MTFCVVCTSCKGSKRAKSSMEVSTTDVDEGGGSRSWYSASLENFA